MLGQGRAWGRMAIAVLLLALAAGCSKVNADNYAKVRANMTRDQVYNVLGKPDEVSGGDIGPISMSTETWKGSKETVTVTFGGDKVVLKSITPNDAAE
jgi:hypothetical protein